MSYTAPPDPSAAASAAPSAPRTFHRSTTDRMVGGVAAGLAEYLGTDVLFVRAGFVIGSFLLAGVGGPLLYMLGWAIVPEEGKTSSLASELFANRP